MTTSGDVDTAAQGLEHELEDVEGLDLDEAYDDEGDYEGEGDSEEESASGSDHDPLVPEWATLENHPPATAHRIRETFQKLVTRGKTRLSILIIGRAGVGKSHTTNSLYAERVAQVVPFHMVSYTNVQPVVVRRKSQGVVFTVIDTPGLVETDGVSEVNLRRVAIQTRTNPVDIVMYVDRLDMQTDDLDLEVFEGIDRTFGSGIWKRVLIGLTRSEMRAPPPGVSYEEAVAARVENIRSGMRQAGAKNASLPYALIENSVRCRVDETTKEKTLPNGQGWIAAFFDAAASLSLANPDNLQYDPGAAAKKDNLIKKFVFVPLAIIAQIIFKVFVLDRIIEDDGTKRDQYGPFDAATVEYEREKLRDRKERDREQRSTAQRRAGKLRMKERQRIEGTLGADASSEDEDDDFFDED